MGIKITFAPDDPNAPKVSWLDSLSGYKTYLVGIAAVVKLWYVAIYGHAWSDNVDTALNATLAILGGMALKSAMKTSTAQIANAVVNPASKEAQAVASQAPKVEEKK